MQLMGWSGVLIAPESFPDNSVTYNQFTYNVDIQPGFTEFSVSFGVKRSNNTVSQYKATYSPAMEKWTLDEITAP